jgi:hypothetical protein
MPVLQAIEAEADSKEEIQNAYDGCLDPDSDTSSVASSFSVLEGDSRYAVPQRLTACFAGMLHSRQSCATCHA